MNIFSPENILFFNKQKSHQKFNDSNTEKKSRIFSQVHLFVK